jgi:glucose-6-phosphate isomerase
MFTMGMLVALEERIVTFLAIFNKINAYDQPGVQDGKRAADGMNALGMEVCAYIEKTVMENGVPLYCSALDLAKMNDWDPISVEWILSDMEANLELPNAYASLKGGITITRKFQDGMFVYDIHRV